MAQTPPNKSKHGLSLRPNAAFFEILVVTVGVVMVWRGVWNFMDMYVFPGHPELSNAVSIITGLVLLYLPDGNIDELV